MNSKSPKNKLKQKDYINISDLTFEQALSSLEEIVEELDGGDIDLEKAIKAYEKGALLRDYCKKMLAEAQERIDKIEIKDNGNYSIKPMDDIKD